MRFEVEIKPTCDTMGCDVYVNGHRIGGVVHLPDPKPDEITAYQDFLIDGEHKRYATTNDAIRTLLCRVNFTDGTMQMQMTVDLSQPPT